MKTKEEIASAWAGIKLEIFTDTKDLKYIHPYITPKQCLRAMEAYKEEAVTELTDCPLEPRLTEATPPGWLTYPVRLKARMAWRSAKGASRAAAVLLSASSEAGSEITARESRDLAVLYCAPSYSIQEGDE